MPRKAQPKIEIELHLAFFVGPVNTESEHTFANANKTTVNAFKKYIKTDFTAMLEEEYNAAHEDEGDSITKKTAKAAVEGDRVELVLKLTVKTTKTMDEVKPDMQRMIQSIGQKSIDQYIIKDKKTGEDFQVNSYIKINYAGLKMGGTKKMRNVSGKNTKTKRNM